MGKFDKFISLATEENKSPSGTMAIADKDGNIMAEEAVPRGFQIDKYVMSIYDRESFSFKWFITSTKEEREVIIFLILSKSGKSLYKLYALFYNQE